MDFKKYKHKAFGLRLCLSMLLVFAGTFSAWAQVAVTGRVLATQGREPIGGVQVSVYGVAGKSAQTDSLGVFSIDMDNMAGALEFKYAGFKTRLVYLSGRTDVTVLLDDELMDSDADQAVWKGPFFAPEDNPYGVTVLRSSDLAGKGHLFLSDALNGLVPGLYSSTRSGFLGFGSTMNIRGTGSMSASTRPVVVIDGVIVENRFGDYSASGGPDFDPLSIVKVGNVESVTVIKDGATSLYGAMGANGVILVRTTRAKASETMVDIESNFGVLFAPKEMPVLDANGHKNLLLEQMQGRGFDYEYLKEYHPFMVGEAEGEEHYRYSSDTDWQDWLYQRGFAQNYSASVRGGDELTNYAATAGYTSVDGFIKNTNYDRFDFGLNSEMSLLRRLTVRPKVMFSRTTSDMRDQSGSEASNPLLASLYKSPMMYPYEISEDGYPLPRFEDVGLFGVSNPKALVEVGTGSSETFRTLAGVDGNLEILSNLGMYFNVGIDLLKFSEDAFVPDVGVAPQLGGSVNNVLKHMERTYYSSYAGLGFDFAQNFGTKHRLAARAGICVKQNDFSESYVVDGNSASDVFTKVGTGSGLHRYLTPTGGLWNAMTLEASANYSYLNKYILAGNVAMEGNSRFDKDYRYGFFYSVGGAWRVSAEPFMATVRGLDELKLRASYGVSGNDDIGNTGALYFYESVPYHNVTAVVRGGVPNPNLRWEETSQYNVGVDMAFAHNFVNLSVDYYDAEITDLLGYRLLPTYYGDQALLSNGGSLKTTGFDVSVNVRAIETKRFGLGFTAILSKYKTEMLSLPSTLGDMPSGENGVADEMLIPIEGGERIARVSSPANLFYGYKTAGVYSTSEAAGADGYVNEAGIPFGAGDVRFVNLDNTDGNKVIDENDKTVIGDPNPDFMGSFTTRLRYGRLNASVMLDFSYGNDIYNHLRRNLESMDTYRNQSTAVESRWRREGNVTDMPKAVYGDSMQNNRFSDRWIEDGSFLRVRNVSLNYSVPLKNLKFVRSLDIHVTGNNLLTFTKYLGFSPDVSAGDGAVGIGADYGRFPVTRSFMAGFKLGI
ncbi:SusC/RagA family TonB-linked outer membrane protein [Fulvitalea axinellae]